MTDVALELSPTVPAGGDVTITDARVVTPSTSSRSPGLEPGHMLAGRYRVARFVAAGGMGEVYEVEDALLGERVALKLLRPELSRKPGAQGRFAEEIRLARRVTHPNVCRVFDVGVDGEQVFFTMELHAGETLAQRLRRTGPMDPDAARPLVRQLLDGVRAAHAADVVHADLKPSNVLLTAKDRVVVTDFGLALPCCAELGCVCDMPHVIGTPAYIAPEQISGGLALERTDVFAIGVILFELLTGVLPFGGNTALETAHARLTEDAPAPSTRRPGLDPQWDAAILACLTRAPEQRPADLGEVARLLGL